MPTSVDEAKHFEWNNLTIACTECNRRKSAYFSVLKPFLDPYLGGIETRLVHLGPIVCWHPGDTIAEATVKTLELHNNARATLVAKKVEHLDHLNNVAARMNEADPLIGDLMTTKGRRDEGC